MIVHFYSRASFVSPHAPPKRSQMAPRTVLAPGYTGWCLACPEAAVASTGGRSRTPLRGSRRARRTAQSTLSPSHRLSRVTTALSELPASSCAEGVGNTSGPCSPELAGESKGSRAAVAGRCRARALWGMSCGGEARLSEMRWSSDTCDRSRERRVHRAAS